MKKSLGVISVTVILTFALLTVSVFAASFTGYIWTNKPGIFNIGYYCTAAQNTSGNPSNDFASATSYNSSGAIIASMSGPGDGAKVANSGYTKPYSGYAGYRRIDFSQNALAYFSPGSWN